MDHARHGHSTRRSPPCDGAHGERRRARSRLRHDGRSRDAQASLRRIAARPTISARPAAAPNSPPIPRNISTSNKPQERAPRSRGHDLHLPDASGDPAGRSRAAARSAAWRSSPRSSSLGCGPNPELADMTRRFWIGAVAVGAAGRARDGRPSRRRPWPDRSRRCRTGSSSPSRRRWCCGRAGRSSCAAGSRCVTRNLNMFTLIAIGTGVAYLYSVVGTVVAAGLSRQPSAAMTARSPSISRPPPSSPCWCCSARCWSCARAKRPRGAIRALLAARAEDRAPRRRRRQRP